MPTLTQCFSALIASGHGQRCNEFRKEIRARFLELDSFTGEHKSIMYKYGGKKYPEQHKLLRREMGQIITAFAEDVNVTFFGPDLGDKAADIDPSPDVFLDAEFEGDVLAFRRAFEMMMKKGYCNGFVGSS